MLQALIARELLLRFRRRADMLMPLLFFVIVTSLFPLGVGPETEILCRMAPGVIWVAAILSQMLSLPSLFAADFADGTLEKIQLSGQSMTLVVMAKVTAHWLAFGVPLIIFAPVLALQFGLPTQAIFAVMASLMLGTPVLSLLGAIGAAVTAGLTGSTVLASLLVLPLCIPVLIFGAGAVDAVANSLEATGHFSLLGAILLLSFVFAPYAISSALVISME